MNKNGKVIYTPEKYCVGWAINAKTALGRLRQQFSRYMHQYYSVHRTSNLKKAFDYDPKKITEPNLIEFYMSTVSCINGKHKVLPIFYTAKETIPGSGADTFPTFHKIMLKKKYDVEARYFLEKVVKHVAKKDKIKPSLARKKLMEIIKANLTRRSKYEKTFKFKLKTILDSKTPKVGILLRNLYFPRKRKKKILAVKNIKGFPFYNNSEDKKELAKINSLIRKHNI